MSIKFAADGITIVINPNEPNSTPQIAFDLSITLSEADRYYDSFDFEYPTLLGVVELVSEREAGQYGDWVVSNVELGTMSYVLYDHIDLDFGVEYFDSFDYQLFNKQTLSYETATVNVKIHGSAEYSDGDLVDDDYQISSDIQSFNGNVFSNDDLSALSNVLTSAAEIHGTYGVLLIQNNGEFEYELYSDLDHLENAIYTDSFDYTLYYTIYREYNNESFETEKKLEFNISNNEVITRHQGGTENDTIYGENQSDVLIGNQGSDHIYGGFGHDVLDGGLDDDWLDGGYGADLMQGGLGDDTYIRNNSGDVIEEQDGEGVDTLYSSIHATLGQFVEHLVLTGDRHMNGKGNDLNNYLTGNMGNNVLTGGLGSDWLEGGAGSDTYRFTRGDGQDTIIDTTQFANQTDQDRIVIRGARANQLWFSQEGDDLRIQLVGTTDQINVQDWFGQSGHRIEEIYSQDGQVLDVSGVLTLVDAMSMMTPPALGETQLSLSQRFELNPVFATTWQATA